MTFLFCIATLIVVYYWTTVNISMGSGIIIELHYISRDSILITEW